MKHYDVYLMPDAIKDLSEIYEYILEASGLPEVAGPISKDYVTNVTVFK